MKDRTTRSEHLQWWRGGGDIRPIVDPPPHFCPDVNWKGSYGSAVKGSWTSVLNGPVIASLAVGMSPKSAAAARNKEKKRKGFLKNGTHQSLPVLAMHHFIWWLYQWLLL
ncbi:hypothetical protein CEXT_222851 [Caerostris extrusa]|uniref:Uncharacterized protein n=1 Tax=Caerostris extrusa TaxID=172846 RepID=A0AAV4NLL0_CAEEX|nr:hypothetical protein CEXT_222851 [Caerostris extrusa]